MPPRPFRWNAAALRYIAPNGRFVSRTAVRNAIDDALDNAGREMRQATVALREGIIGVDQWRNTMRREIKNVHLYSAASARGGWAQLSQAELGRVGGIVGRQYQYLDEFADGLKNGTIAKDGRILSRADMYAQAGRRTYHVTDERVHLERGYTEERNRLRPGENCSECISQTARGWVAIGELVAIGLRICLSRCKCYIEYRTG